MAKPMGRSVASLELLRRLGGQYESAIVPFDPAFLQTHLDKIRTAPAAL